LVVKGVFEQKDIEQLIEFAENERERERVWDRIDRFCMLNSFNRKITICRGEKPMEQCQRNAQE